MSWSLAIRVVPNAKKNEILGAHGSAIRVKIAAPALDGKANAALLAFLAEQIGIPKNQVQLLAGEKSRDKVVGGPGAQPTLPASFRVPEASKKPV
jgi:uncharacterized protein (TIGR00251 family)